MAERLFAWVDKRGDLTEFYGSGKKDGSFQAGFDDDGRYLFPFALYGYGRIEIHFQYIKRSSRPSREKPIVSARLLSRLYKIPGVSIGEDMLKRRPSIPLDALVEPEAFNQFKATLDWAFHRVRPSTSKAARLERLARSRRGPWQGRCTFVPGTAPVPDRSLRDDRQREPRAVRARLAWQATALASRSPPPEIVFADWALKNPGVVSPSIVTSTVCTTISTIVPFCHPSASASSMKTCRSIPPSS